MNTEKHNWCGLWTDDTRFNFRIIFMLIAAELMLSFSPFGFIDIYSISFTTVHLVVMAAAMWSGPVGGAILGLVFGFCSAWKAGTTGVLVTDMVFAPFRSGNPLGSIILAVGIRILFGVLAGILFSLYFRYVKKHRVFFLPLIAILLDRLHSLLIYSGISLLFQVEGLGPQLTFKHMFRTGNIVLYLVASAVLIVYYVFCSGPQAERYYSNWKKVSKYKKKIRVITIIRMALVVAFIASMLVYLATRTAAICEIENILIGQEGIARLIHVVMQFFIAILALLILIMDANSFEIQCQQIERQEESERALREVQAANNAKTIFLNNMSHDLRTPMNAILGFTTLLKKHYDDKQRSEDYIKKIEYSGEYLLTIINNVLDMAKIDSGKMILDEQFNDLSRGRWNIFSVCEAEIEKKNLNLVVDKDITHYYIFADSVKIEQIWMNLLSNAVKYTSDGGTIKMFMREVPCEKEGYATFVTTLSDNGIGMSKEYLEHVFDSFSRERTTKESNVVGSGLGMGIVKSLVDLMGGTIDIESVQGMGTTVTVTLSHRIVDNPEQYLANSKEKDYEQISFKGKRILLVEDNELNSEIAETVLRDAGFEVETAEDGIICIEKVYAADPAYYDAILMDIQMPNMNGFEATARIRRMPDRRASIPIIAMTANAFDEDKREAYDAGMNGHVSKPFKLSALLTELARVVGEGEPCVDSAVVEADKDFYEADRHIRNFVEIIKGNPEAQFMICFMGRSLPATFSEYYENHTEDGKAYMEICFWDGDSGNLFTVDYRLVPDKIFVNGNTVEI